MKKLKLSFILCILISLLGCGRVPTSNTSGDVQDPAESTLKMESTTEFSSGDASKLEDAVVDEDIIVDAASDDQDGSAVDPDSMTPEEIQEEEEFKKSAKTDFRTLDTE